MVMDSEFLARISPHSDCPDLPVGLGSQFLAARTPFRIITPWWGKVDLGEYRAAGLPP